MTCSQHTTRGGIRVRREEETLEGATAARRAIEPLIDALDERRGAVFASTCEVPGRYALWDRGFIDPPIAIECRGLEARVCALNGRGRVLLPALRTAAAGAPGARVLPGENEQEVRIGIQPGREPFTEEERSRQPSIFGLLRRLLELFACDDPDLGLYGAFGYDLAFQFDPQPLRHPRAPDQRDLVLYLPDEIVVVDHRREKTHRVRFELDVGRRRDVEGPVVQAVHALDRRLAAVFPRDAATDSGDVGAVHVLEVAPGDD